MIEFVVISAVFWGVCGFLTYGWSFAYWQRRYPEIAAENYREDKINSLFFAALGPIGLLTVIAQEGWRYGFKLK
jgi:hypothetical protein